MSKKQIIIVCLTLFFFIFFSQAWGQSPAPAVTLTWSSNTYVPLDYPAKALPSSKSTIEVVATIGSPNNPQKLYYTWFLNNSLQESRSGQGKQTFVFQADELASRSLVKTIVRNEQKEFLGEKEIAIKIVKPEIIISQISPSGPSKQTAKTYYLGPESETVFSATPYFFNIKNPNQLNYDWQFNGQTAKEINSQKPNFLTLAIGRAVNGLKNTLLVRAEDKNNFLSNTQTNVQIIIIND